MRQKYSSLLLCLSLGALILLFGACTTTIGPTGGTTPTPSSLTVLQVLQNSQKAMSNLKSAHVNLQANGSGQSAGNSAGTPTQISFKVTGSGDEALPSQEELHLTTTQNLTNTTNAVTEILAGNHLYVQSAGQWYMLNSSQLGNVGNPFAGFGSANINELLGLLAHTQISDHGDQNLNGMTLRHITFALDKYALQQLLQSDTQLVNMLGQQNINAIINNAKTVNATLDLWIDEQQFYVHRTELKLNLNVNAASLSQSITPTVNPAVKGLIPANVISHLDSIVDLSNYNETVSITPPASATPITVPSATPTV